MRLEQTTNVQGEIILSDYISIKEKDYNCVKNDSIRISAFYYHRKDTLPCELVYVDDEVSIDEVYSIRNEGMYNIPKEYNDYQFPKSEIVRFVVRGINPRETKKWIKFEQGALP